MTFTTIIALLALALSAYLAAQVRKLAKALNPPVESTLKVTINEVDLATAVKDAIEHHIRNYHKGR